MLGAEYDSFFVEEAIRRREEGLWRLGLFPWYDGVRRASFGCLLSPHVGGRIAPQYGPVRISATNLSPTPPTPLAQCLPPTLLARWLPPDVCRHPTIMCAVRCLLV